MDLSGKKDENGTLLSEEYEARDVTKVGGKVRALEAAQTIARFIMTRGFLSS